MMRSLYSAVSGLKTHQTKMDVIGNNISNVNTVGFKSSSVTFSEIMYQTISNASGPVAGGKGGVNAKQIGLGVSTGSTKVSVTTSGAAETTGNPFDIRLTDTNSTNFFVVNNGSENLFTRAGSFYIDGGGNLCMTSTGYTVMGWQVDPDTMQIKKDTVSALKIMQEKNLTSSPEATTKARVSGVMDKNDTNVTSDSGYVMNLNFYDKLGYAYTAKFAVKIEDPNTETYTVELSDILDSNNKSILKDYINGTGEYKGKGGSLSNIFGLNTTASKTYNIANKDIKYTAEDIVINGVNVAAKNYYYEYTTYNGNGEAITQPAIINIDKTNGTYSLANTYTYYASAEDMKNGVESTLSVSGDLTELFGITQEQLQTLDSATAPRAVLDDETGAFLYTEPAVNYTLKFSPDDGSFTYVGRAGSDTVTLNLAKTLGGNFEDIEIDFSQCKAADNGGKTSLGMDPGALDKTTGVGKALGVMTGISIDNSGKIYGSYDNGNTVLLGQIAVAQFANASGLEKIGENCYKTTLNSGDFDGIGVEISADGSSMSTGELEMSNVDLSSEFTQMIVTQRGFQSNSRVITTSDSLLEELINLKR